MSNNLTPLVPEKTYAVCTNGTKKGEIVVGHHDDVMKINTCLMATIQDKPTNCACVYMGILIAVVGGLLTALFVSGVGATVGCLLLVALVSILGAYGLGGVVCYFCLMPSQWIGFHPHILINKQPAIIGTSTIMCQPLWFTPGKITLFYSKDVASRVANVYKWQNWQRIFNHTLNAWGIPGLLYNATSGFLMDGLMKGTFELIKTLGIGYLGGRGLSIMQEGISERVADSFTQRNPNNSSDSKFQEVYQKDEYEFDFYNDVISGEDVPAWFGKSGTIEIALNGTYTNADRSRVMLWRHHVWGNMPGTNNSTATKKAWKWDKQLGNNKQSAKRALSVLALGFVGDIMFGARVNYLKNKFVNDLPELENWENEAKIKVEIFEETV